MLGMYRPTGEEGRISNHWCSGGSRLLCTVTPPSSKTLPYSMRTRIGLDSARSAHLMSKSKSETAL